MLDLFQLQCKYLADEDKISFSAQFFMAQMCHEELGNKAQLPPGNSFLCFSLKCRIHRLLIKTVVLCSATFTLAQSWEFHKQMLADCLCFSLRGSAVARRNAAAYFCVEEWQL